MTRPSGDQAHRTALCAPGQLHFALLAAPGDHVPHREDERGEEEDDGNGRSGADLTLDEGQTVHEQRERLRLVDRPAVRDHEDEVEDVEAADRCDQRRQEKRLADVRDDDAADGRDRSGAVDLRGAKDVLGDVGQRRAHDEEHEPEAGPDVRHRRRVAQAAANCSTALSWPQITAAGLRWPQAGAALLLQASPTHRPCGHARVPRRR